VTVGVATRWPSGPSVGNAATATKSDGSGPGGRRFKSGPGHHQHYTVFRIPISIELNPRLGDKERKKARK